MSDDHAPSSNLAPLLGLFECLIVLTVWIGSAHRVWLFPIITGVGVYLAFYTTFGQKSSDYAILGYTVLTHLLTASDYILLTNSQYILKPKNQQVPAAQLPWLPRLKWSLQLLTNPRCVGWTHEPTSALPPRPAQSVSRIAFITSKISWIAIYFSLRYVMQTYTAKYPHTEPYAWPSLTGYRWLWQINIFGWVLPAVTMLGMQHCVVSAIAVATGISAPEAWPPLFGSWTDAWTVRRFWGRTWHQLLRRPLSSHAKFLAHRVLRFRPGGNASAYTQLYTAFFLSGVIHYVADYKVLGDWSGGSPRFFMSQAVIITFEDAVIALASWLGVRRERKLWKVLGYVWVYVWIAYTTPGFLVPLFEAGYLE